MNTVPTITPGSITGIGGLTVRPVYFLRLNGANNPSLVVKGESNVSHGATSVAWGAKLMKNVNDIQVNTKMMTPAGITCVQRPCPISISALPHLPSPAALESTSTPTAAEFSAD